MVLNLLCIQYTEKHSRRQLHPHSKRVFFATEDFFWDHPKGE